MGNSHREKVFISGERSHEQRGHSPYMVRTVLARLRSVKPVLMTVTVETRYDIIDVETLLKSKMIMGKKLKVNKFGKECIDELRETTIPA